MSAETIAEAYRGLTTGDQDPPRPWAHLSHVGTISSVSQVAALQIDGFADVAAFGITVDGVTYQVEIKRTHLP